MEIKVAILLLFCCFLLFFAVFLLFCYFIIYHKYNIIFEIKKEQSQQKQSVESSKITPVKGPEYNSVSFTRRSDSEINIAKQIKEKNMAIKQQKEQQRSLEKPKVKTLTKSPNNGNGSSSSGGFVNTLILTLITGFIAGALFMVVYYICK